MSQAIAVVGMACRYPGADNTRQLWENVLARRRSFRRIPSIRISLDDYLADKNDSGDNFYISEAAVIEGYQFDRVKYRVVGSTYRSVDLTHWLALDVAADALADAGFVDGAGLPRKNTGVLIGNTLTGEFSRAALLRLRWPYVRRIFDARLRNIGWSTEQRLDFFAQTEKEFKAPFEPVNEETLAGGLANTIAGRICNYFDLAGGGYTVDGACSSSLLAINHACNALSIGDLDVVIAGGVDLSLDPFELIGFSKVTALADGDMRVYDQHAQGFLPGEGCGMVVLMRHQDALQQGLRCYASIQGWGISSDGSGGITRPESQGQRLAIQRAYQRADYDISTVALFEGHGTGTKVGDAVELSALSDELNAHQTSEKSFISSIKANIGHTKAAAGTAGFIKAVMALHHQVIPPATGFSVPNTVLESPQCSLQVPGMGQCWPHSKALRSGVSSFGFGGINVHLTLQGNLAQADKLTLSEQECKLMRSYQDAELFLFSAQSISQLEHSIQLVLDFSAALSYAELVDLAVALTKQADINRAYRAAVIASSPRQLKIRLEKLLLKLATHVEQSVDLGESIFIGSTVNKPRIVFMFPGQAAPVRLNGGLMAHRFALVNALYQGCDFSKCGEEMSTALAQPSIIIAQLAGLCLLEKFGIEAHSVLGHSLGELSALHWSGAMDQATLLRLASIRGSVMSQAAAGCMASIAGSGKDVEQWLKGEDEIVIAAYNAPNQTVVAGSVIAVKRFVGKVQKKGVNAQLLPVSHAFHSPFMNSVTAALHDLFCQEIFKPMHRRCFSTVTGNELNNDTNLADLLTRQLTQPVLFEDTARLLLDSADLCIEVGPGHIISSLLAENTQVPVISMDSSADSLQGFVQVIAAAFVVAAPINKAALFEDRFYRTFTLDWQPKFFANPCEAAPALDEEVVSITTVPPVGTQLHADTVLDEETLSALDPLALVMQLISERTELPVTSLTKESRLLGDLHLNSISVTELLVAASRHMKLATPSAPMDYSNATIAELADSLAQLKSLGNATQTPHSRYPEGIDNWVRAYVLEQTEAGLPDIVIDKQGGGSWQLFSNRSHEQIQALITELNSWGGKGILLVIDEAFEQTDIALILKASQAALAQQSTTDYFVLIQQQAGLAASIIRTLHLESQHLITLVLEIPVTHHQLNQWVISELQAADQYVEACYNDAGVRRQYSLQLISSTSDKHRLPIAQNDVLLVTGGGKGIAAESALMLVVATGACLVILGRSAPETDEELATNLQRFSAAQVNYRYIKADISSAEQLQQAMTRIEAELGSVTAILHGAGVNQPTLLPELTVAAFNATLAPKVQGLKNLLEQVKVEKLKLLISFGSIIARSGMRGEADYALANAWQTQLVEDFQQDHPRCRCLSIEWSVWSGVGMGERLGRIDALLQAGIAPIVPEQGIAIMRELICLPSIPAAVIVSGRMGEMATLKLPQKELPFLRFLERQRIYYPGVELIVETDINVDSDPYLADHVFQNEQIIPGVIGLEAIAQVAMTLADQQRPPVFEQVEFLQPLVVNDQETITLRIVALMRSKHKVEVVIRCNKTHFLSNHFKASCLFTEINDADADVFSVEPSLTPPTINPQTDLYNDLFFHKGRFVRVKNYHYLDAWQCRAEIGTGKEQGWFSRYLPQNLLLGDPGSRDAAIHALQVCIPHSLVIPIAIEQIQLLDVNCQGPWILQAREFSHQGDEYIFDLQLINQQGKRREIWRGLTLKKVADKQQQHCFDDLLPAYLQRHLEAINCVERINVALLRGADSERKQNARQAIQNSLRARVEVCYSSVGKPEVKGYYVSVAHHGDLTLAVSSKETVSCDIERIMTQENDFWLAALGEYAMNLAEQIMQQSKTECYDFAMTRLWSVLECLKKAGLPLDTPLLLQSIATDGWVTLEAGQYKIGSAIINFRQTEQEYAMAVLFPKTRHDS